MDELEKKLKEVLDNMNNTFEYSPEMDENENVTKITVEMKNDGSEFLEAFISLFGPLINTYSKGKKEIVFEENYGLNIKNID